MEIDIIITLIVYMFVGLMVSSALIIIDYCLDEKTTVHEYIEQYIEDIVLFIVLCIMFWPFAMILLMAVYGVKSVLMFVDKRRKKDVYDENKDI